MPERTNHKADGDDEDSPGLRTEFNKETEASKRTQMERRQN